ncbi:hypothetical protein II654_02150 [bacterium]|nr:hypothetical protein [bacterium]
MIPKPKLNVEIKENNQPILDLYFAMVSNPLSTTIYYYVHHKLVDFTLSTII